MLLTRGTGDVSMKSLTTLAVPENKPLMWQGSVGEDLQHLEKDRLIHTDPDETRRRRTIKLDRDKNTFGFTLQTYGIKNKKTNELEVMTYVDYVELNGPAGLAGMRKGDVILSVNGENVEGIPHKLLVKKIQENKGTSLRLVVLFEDCCRKVELYERFIKLKQVLKMKLDEYRYLEKKEHCILEGHGGFSRMSSVRSSLRSSSSSDWDRFSMVVSPAQMLQNMPKAGPHHFLFPRAYPSSADNSSEISLNDVSLNDSFSDDSDAFLSASCSDIASIQGLRRNKMNSLSNQSVSSLITQAGDRRSGESGEGAPQDVRNDGDSSVRVVFSLDGEEADTRADEKCSAKQNLPTDVQDIKSEILNKDENNDMKALSEDNAGSDNTSDENGDSKPEKVESDVPVSVPLQENVLSDDAVESCKENSSTKGDNFSGKTTKRFVKGVLVNDFDQVTKL